MNTNIFTNFHNKTLISIIVLSFAFFFVCPLKANESEEALNVFKNIVEMRRLEESAVKSVETEYEFKHIFEGFEKEMNLENVIKKCSFGRMGERFYMSETQQLPNTSDVITRSVTFDGMFARRRNSVAWKNLMMLGQSDDALKLPTPPPSKLIEPHSIQELYDAVKKGELQVLSAENIKVNGENCIKITFDILRKDVPAGVAECYYSIERGYWPILFKRYKADGILLAEITNIELIKVIKGGNEIFYPLRGEWRVYGEDEKMVTRSLNLNKDSLKINEPIPDSKFTMILGRDEMLYDMELGIQLIDPGKKIDLSILDAPIKATNNMKNDKVESDTELHSKPKPSKNDPKILKDDTKLSFAKTSLPVEIVQRNTMDFKILSGIIFLAVLIVIGIISLIRARKATVSQ